MFCFMETSHEMLHLSFITLVSRFKLGLYTEGIVIICFYPDDEGDRFLQMLLTSHKTT
jgi:hypothetical protein